MAYKVVVCDDEETIIRQLNSYIKQIEKETGNVFEVQNYASAEELLENITGDVDILLLDIEMDELNGMDGARILRDRGIESTIIFITNMLEYAIEGYDVNAHAFLAKPVSYENLKSKILSSLEHLHRRQKAVLQVHTPQEEILLQIDEIIYIEVYQHETTFFLKDREVQSNTFSITQLEKKLKSFGFYRCHRSYLVNMTKIERIGQSDLIMTDHKAIPLSRHRRKAFMDAFAAYMGDRFA